MYMDSTEWWSCLQMHDETGGAISKEDRKVEMRISLTYRNSDNVVRNTGNYILAIMNGAG
jgi:hypothetical protein